MTEKQPGGKRKVEATIAGAVARLDLQKQRKGPDWPARGGAHAGILPGQWRSDGPLDDTGLLPSDCPVKPLGYQGEDFYFVDTRGQVFNSGTMALGVERMQKLFAGNEAFLEWGWPSFDKNARVVGFKAELARRDLFAACEKRGPWSMTDMVRGRGAWRDELGKLVIHCGEALYVDGQLRDTGEVGKHFYARRPALFYPWERPVAVEDNPAIELAKMLRTWNFARGDTDCILLVGWMGVALLGAALDWRPSVFIVGDRGTGKSELHRLLKAVFGRGMISTTNATEAGLYQLIGHDSVPICIDELEGDDSVDQSQRIIKMARDAASGSVRIRGGADHKGVEFQARSAFLFSAINPPPIPAASMTRLAVLQLKELKSHAGKVPVLKASETIGPRLLRQVIDGWPSFPKIYEDFRTVLREHGHDSRGQNTFGTLLAAAHLLLGDEGLDALGLPYENLDEWGVKLAASTLPELANVQPNWAEFIDLVLTNQVEAWTRGEKHTVGQLLVELRTGLFSTQEVEGKLAQADLGLVPKKLVGSDYGLAIPHRGTALGRLLADTKYVGRGGAGGWQFVLRGAPPEIVKFTLARHGSEDNRFMIGGVQRRCTFVSIADFEAWKGKFG